MFKKILLLGLFFVSATEALATDRMRFLFKDREALQARVDIIQQAEKEIYEAIRFDWEKQRQLYMPSMRNQGIDSEGSRG